MKVLQIAGPGTAEWDDISMPAPGTGEVLVKVLGVTTCPHWDLHMMDGQPMFPGGELQYPLVPGQPGHEMVGEVVEVGAGVETPVLGDRVAAWRDRGPGAAQGCYAQYVAFDADCLLVVPRTLELEEIAPLELAMCVQVTFDQLEGKSGGVRGKRVGVAGLGPAGLIAAQMALSYGASHVTGIDPLPDRREAAIELGIHEVAVGVGDFPPGRQTARSLDIAIDATGLKTAIEFLMDRTREVVAIFGVLRETIEMTAQHTHGGFSLMGYGRHNLQAAEAALALIERGTVKLAPLVSRTMSFGQYRKGVELLREKKATKILFSPWME